MLKEYHTSNEGEVGIDEAGRGCLFGPVSVAGVIWVNEEKGPIVEIKDSKKCSQKHREKCYQYIINQSKAYSIQMIDNNKIDEKNILECSIDGMHACLDEISENYSFDKILVDGNRFRTYYCKEKDDFINHECIIKGDNTYKSIAAASILAKTYRDNYILKLVEKYPELKKYDIHNNKGYGTKKHMDAIQKYGITKLHRKTFSTCTAALMEGQGINQMIE